MELKNINSKDLKILQILDSDVRASFSDIARKAGIPKEVVQYRIKRLEEDNIIKGYWAFVSNLIGPVYKILIKNKNLFGEKKKEFIDFVRNYKIVAWFANTEGNFDYVITVYAKCDMDTVLFFNELFEQFGSYFKEKHILKSFKSNMTNDKFLFDGKFIYNYVNSFCNKEIKIDDVDDKLMTLLSLNARSKFTDMAKVVKLTPEAVKHRYDLLLKNNRITGFKVRINWEKLGLAYYHIFVTLQNPSKRKELINYYTTHPLCNASMQHIGYYDLHIELFLPIEKIEFFMEEFVSKFGNDISGYELLRIRQEYVLNILK